MLKRIIGAPLIGASLLLLAFSSISVAEPQRPGMGGPPQMGGGRGGRGGGMMVSPMRLLRREDVQRDLNLTAKQKAALASLMPQRGGGPGMGRPGGPPPGGPASGGPGMRPGGPGMGGPGMGGPGGMNREEREKKIKAILSPAQNKRLKEIGVQVYGMLSVMNPEIQKDLGITSKQRDQIMKALPMPGGPGMGRPGGPPPGGPGMRPGGPGMGGPGGRPGMGGPGMGGPGMGGPGGMAGMRKMLEDKISPILTSSQKAKLKAMGGKPFKADPRGGGRGRA